MIVFSFFSVSNNRSLAVSSGPFLSDAGFCGVFSFVLFWFNVNRNTTLNPDVAGVCNWPCGLAGSVMACKSTTVCVWFTAWLLF